MKQSLTITNDLSFVRSLHFVIQTYQELSAMKIRQIRESVLETRRFFNNLSGVFYEVRSSYQRQVELLKKKNPKIVVAPKKATIFISANTKLYGDIIPRVFNEFMQYIEKNNDDIFIIGNMGQEMWTSRGLKRTFKFFSIPDIFVDADDLKQIVPEMAVYETITVYYGKFESVITQKPAFSNITGDEIYAYQPEQNQADKKRKFLFEPDLKTIVNFFKTQAVASLFKQTVHEAHLGRLASRIKAMEEGLDAVNIKERQLLIKQRAFNRRWQNKAQLEQLAGISLWHN